MLETLLDLFEGYHNTCSIENIKKKHVSFVRDISYLYYLNKEDRDAWIMIPDNTPKSIIQHNNNLKFYRSKYPEYEFTIFHNELYKYKRNKTNIIGNQCKIHSSVILDAEGLKVVNTPSGEKIQFVHTGNVEIGDNVEIGPYTVIHKGTLDKTVIEDGCKIGTHNNIGHNCFIGKNTIIAAGTILNGGVKIGRDCWVSSGVMIKHHTDICDNVVIGLGSVVIKDIDEPGIYAGNPARFIKPIEEGWNF
jgi:UDP-3-O-[3-hydroxymyristoyl] glucosamine N-acyltransferase